MMNTVGSMVMSDRKKILLHTCCAPCATYPVELLLSLDTDIVLFFSNANIFPETEYAKRLESARNLSSRLNLSLIEDVYDHHAWLRHIKGLEREPEHGRRCIKCFEYSLTRTAMAAQDLSIPCFTTTLTVSRHKPSKVLFEVGSHLAGFCPVDFKKNNGFSKSIELSRKYNLYRQNYCGCEFSMRITP